MKGLSSKLCVFNISSQAKHHHEFKLVFAGGYTQLLAVTLQICSTSRSFQMCPSIFIWINKGHTPRNTLAPLTGVHLSQDGSNTLVILPGCLWTSSNKISCSSIILVSRDAPSSCSGGRRDRYLSVAVPGMSCTCRSEQYLSVFCVTVPGKGSRASTQSKVETLRGSTVYQARMN